MHYGRELALEPFPSQKRINKHLMSLGVDMIIGTHPHVLQDHCLHDNKLIAYSLGNFLFHTNQPPSAVDPVTHSYGSTSDYKYLLTEWKGRLGKCLGGWLDVNTSPCSILTTSPQIFQSFSSMGKEKTMKVSSNDSKLRRSYLTPNIQMKGRELFGKPGHTKFIFGKLASRILLRSAI